MWPSRKWWAAQVVAVGGIATSVVNSGFDSTEANLLIGWFVQAAVTYLLPNSEPEPRAAVLESSRGSRADRSR